MKIRPFLFIFVAATLAFPRLDAAAQNPSAVRIVAPQPGEKLQQNAVTVRYEIDRPQVIAASTPTFKVRLDDRDPVSTEQKESTFTGLAPGKHTLTIEVVDANGTPVWGTHTQIQFTVAPPPTPAETTGETQPAPAAPRKQHRKRPPQTPSPPQASLKEPVIFTASLKIVPRASLNGPTGAPDNGRLADDGNLPETASALPLLSAIGAGVLIGGLFSARRTRPGK